MYEIRYGYGWFVYLHFVNLSKNQHALTSLHLTPRRDCGDGEGKYGVGEHGVGTQSLRLYDSSSN